MYNTEYGYGVEVEGNFDDVVQQTIDALSNEGFGILSDIDVKATLKKKLDIDFRQYRILGACNPPYAHQALEMEIELGLLLPCNVIVYETEEQKCRVVAVDPVKNLSIVGNKDLAPVAETIKQKMIRVLEALEKKVPAGTQGGE